MRKPESSDRFAIFIKNNLHADDLSYEEMGNMLMDLAQDYDLEGEPDPKDIEVKLKLGDTYGKAPFTDQR
jgi:hypothetical protein